MAVFDSMSKGVVSRRWGSLVAAGLLSFTLYGCGSSDSTTVAPPVVPPVVDIPVVIDVAAVIAAAAADPANDAAVSSGAPFVAMKDTGLAAVTVNTTPVVNFSVFSGGEVVTGLTTSNVSFALAKLVPGTNSEPEQWVSYIYRTETATAGVGPGGTPVLATAMQATTDSKVATQLVYNPAGYYTYTFATDVKDPTKTNGVVFEAGRTHRIAIQLSYKDASGATVRVNPYYDFTIGADGKSVAATSSRTMVDIKSCNNCHEKLALHGGGRVDTQYCVLCHNPGTTDANSGNVLDLAMMVHKIHMGKELPSNVAGGEYTIWGYRDTPHEYSQVGFPQDIRNCIKCHNGDANPAADVAFTTPQGNNWYLAPSRQKCGSCHDGIDFATSTGTTISGTANAHTSGAFGLADDSACVLCHGDDKGLAVKLVHVTGDPTPNNPDVPVGAANFTYEINSVAVNASNETVIQFRIKKDGTALDLSAASPSGFTGGPSFLFAWAMGQDGVASPADFNNLGTTDGVFVAGQTRGDAFSRSLAALRTAPNTMTYDAGTGLNTATLKDAAYKFPAGAKMRTIGLQGYFSQTGIGARHAISVAKTVTGDTARRSVVDSDKCANCHDWLSLHGGNRVYEIQVCVMCHNPSKATSGRGITDAVWDTYTSTGPNFSASDLEIMALWGFNLTATNRALQFPVVSNNMKDMIHGMHAQKDRTAPFRDARDRTPAAITLLDFSRIAFPGVLQNCETCHKPGTYASVPATALASTQEFRDEAYVTAALNDLTTPTIAKAALKQPNPGDVVATPFAAACVSCHDDALAKSHIGLNGGIIGTTVGAQEEATDTRSLMMSKGGPASETCSLCHGTGKIADVKVVHGQ